MKSCRQGRSFGFDGKTLIHPSQIAPATKSMRPRPTKSKPPARSSRAFARPENKGKGAIALDGRMVELLHAEIAHNTVALAEAIAALEAS